MATEGLDYVEVSFGDRTRRLRYSIATLRDLCQALGNLTLIDLLTRLGGMDVNAVLQCVRYGLMHESPRLTLLETSNLLEAHIRQHGDASRVLTAVSEALEATGMISTGRGRSSGEAKGDPPAG